MQGAVLSAGTCSCLFTGANAGGVVLPAGNRVSPCTGLSEGPVLSEAPLSASGVLIPVPPVQVSWPDLHGSHHRHFLQWKKPVILRQKRSCVSGGGWLEQLLP